MVSRNTFLNNQDNMNFLVKINSKHILIFVCAFYTIFNLLLIHPANLGVEKVNERTYGKIDHHILKVWRRAKERSIKPFFEVKDHMLYHERNPAIFQFIVELYQRAGFKTPIFLQLLLIFLVNLGIIAQRTWLKEFFNNDIIPSISLLFIIFSHFLLFMGPSLHQHLYNFTFFNFSMMFLVKFLNTKKRKYFIFTLLSYFVITNNYYMFWVSTYIMMVGALWSKKEKKLILKSFLLGTPVILTFILLFFQISYVKGGVNKTIDTIETAIKARALNQEVKGNNPGFKKTGVSIARYPHIASQRVERYFYLSGFAFFIVFGITLWLKRKNKSQLNYRLLYAAFPAGLSWYILMSQHTVMHYLSGRYSYMLWMLIMCYFVYEVIIYSKNKFPNTPWKPFQYLSLFLLVYIGYGFSFVTLTTFFGNIYRITYEHPNLMEKAKRGDLESRLKLFSNKFLVEYNWIPINWIKDLQNKNIELCPGTQYKFHKKFNEFSYFYIYKDSSSPDCKNVRRLIIGNSNKQRKIKGPNEFIQYWKYNNHIVFKFKNIDGDRFEIPTMKI